MRNKTLIYLYEQMQLNTSSMTSSVKRLVPCCDLVKDDPIWVNSTEEFTRLFDLESLPSPFPSLFPSSLENNLFSVEVTEFTLGIAESEISLNKLQITTIVI